MGHVCDLCQTFSQKGEKRGRAVGEARAVEETEAGLVKDQHNVTDNGPGRYFPNSLQ